MIPIVFQHEIQVKASDIDELNHVNNIVYLKYIQDVAQAHWESIMHHPDMEAIRWVARRHEIDYLKQAFLDDILIVKTWVEGFTGVTSIRHCEIYKNEVLITKSKTIWVALDSISFKPRRLSPTLVESFFA